MCVGDRIREGVVKKGRENQQLPWPSRAGCNWINKFDHTHTHLLCNPGKWKAYPVSRRPNLPLYFSIWVVSGVALVHLTLRYVFCGGNCRMGVEIDVRHDLLVHSRQCRCFSFADTSLALRARRGISCIQTRPLEGAATRGRYKGGGGAALMKDHSVIFIGKGLTFLNSLLCMMKRYWHSLFLQ